VTRRGTLPRLQVVGLYEGRTYYHCDGFRPVFSCMMRNYAAYCPVCTRRILEVLAPFQPANSAPACAAGGPYVAECAGATTSVQLNGTGSSDFDCDPLTLTWTGPFAGGSVSGTMPPWLLGDGRLQRRSRSGRRRRQLHLRGSGHRPGHDAAIDQRAADVTVECAAPGALP